MDQGNHSEIRSNRPGHSGKWHFTSANRNGFSQDVLCEGNSGTVQRRSLECFHIRPDTNPRIDVISSISQEDLLEPSQALQ